MAGHQEGRIGFPGTSVDSLQVMDNHPLTVAWVSYFPLEWLPDPPEPIRLLPKRHPATWQRVLVDELKNRPGLKLHVIDLRNQLREDVTFEWDGVTFHGLKVPPLCRAPSLFWVDTFRIRRKLRQNNPDVVHAWGNEQGAALVASRLRYPYLVSVQGLLEWFVQVLQLSFYDRLTARVERISLRRASVATAESTFTADWLRQRHPRLDVRHVEYSPNWLFYHIERRPQTQPLRFLFVGAVSVRKGSDMLLLALDKLRTEIDFQLILVGIPHPEFIARMKARTSQALWERVEIIQSPPTSEVTEQLARATMVLFPARAETGPLAVKEAAVAGVPVVGGATGGIPDYIADDKNGFIFPPGDLPAFMNAIRRACAHPMFGRGLVDPATLAQVRAHLAPSRMAEGFHSIYRQLAKNAR